MAEEKTVGFKLYRHYVWFAIASGLFLPAVVAVEGNGSFGIEVAAKLAIYLLMGAAVVHASIWSVLGDRSIVKRTLSSLGIFLIGLAGLIAAFAVDLWSYDPAEVLLMGQVGLLLALPAIVAAQVPFWFLRFALGWQLVRGGEQPVVMTIKQLFLITLVFGIAFAMPSIAGRLYVSAEAAKRLALGDTTFEYVPGENETFERKEIVVTLENRPELVVQLKRSGLARMRTMMLFGGALLATLSLLSIPVFWFAFRFPNRKSVLYSVLYGVLLYCLVGIGCMLFFGLTYFWFKVSPPLIYGIALSVFMIATPLLISNSKGIWLSTARMRPAEVEVASELVVDPLA